MCPSELVIELRRQRQFTRTAFAALFCLIAVLLLVGFDSAQNNTAQLFKVIDKSGVIRAELGILDDRGRVGFRIFGADGNKEVVSISQYGQDDMTVVNLFNPRDRSSIGLTLEAGSGPAIELRTGGKTLCEVKCSDRGTLLQIGATELVCGSKEDRKLLINANQVTLIDSEGKTVKDIASK